jgi:hypothetical protein
VSRLEDFNIQCIAAGLEGVDGYGYSVFVRDNCMAVAGGPNGANRGSTGLMTEQGIGFLLWRDGQPYLAAKGFETPATPEQMETIRQFSEDLDKVLNTGPSK